MARKFASYLLVILVAMVATEAFHPFALLNTSAQGSCRTFTETGKTLCGRFLEYWNTHGGLAQQGFPISSEFTEVSDLNGQPYTVQYFERAVFEKHPENAAPNDVLLSQLGTFQFKRKYPSGEPTSGQPPAQPAPPPPPAPASIVGQTIEYPGFLGRGKLRGTVTDVKEANSIPSSGFWDGGTARGKYVLVYMNVMPVGNESVEPWYSGLKLKDGAGRTYDAVDDLDIYEPVIDTCACAQYTDKLQPGLPTPMVYVFDVAKDASNYLLVSVSQ